MTKNTKIIVIILIIVLLGVCLFYFLLPRPQDHSSPPSVLTDEERLESLQKASDVPPANPGMTDKERLNLLSQPSKIPPLKN